MDIPEESGEHAIQHAWDFSMAASKHAGTTLLIAKLIRNTPSLVPGLDANRLASVINGTLRVKPGPNSSPDIYVLANRGKWGPLCEALRELVEAGGFQGLAELADLLALRRRRGNPKSSRLNWAVQDHVFYLAVMEERSVANSSVEAAIAEVARVYGTSESTVQKCYQRQKLRETGSVDHLEP